MDNANLISNKQISPIFNNMGSVPNLKDKHGIRRFQPCFQCSEKVIAASRGETHTPEGTNYPLPLDLCVLKKLLECSLYE